MKQDWVDDYKKSLAQLYASNALMKGQPTALPSPVFNATPATFSGGGTPLSGGNFVTQDPITENEDGRSLRDITSSIKNRGGQALSGILDVLLSGAYGSAQAFEAVVEAGSDKADAGEDFTNFAKSLVGAGPVGFEGYKAFARAVNPINRDAEDRDTFADVLAKAGYKNNIGVGAGGFALDVLADPVTYAPAGLIAKGVGKVGSAVGDATGIGKGSRLVENTPDLSPEELARLNPEDLPVEPLGLPAGNNGQALAIEPRRPDQPAIGEGPRTFQGDPNGEISRLFPQYNTPGSFAVDSNGVTNRLNGQDGALAAPEPSRAPLSPVDLEPLSRATLTPESPTAATTASPGPTPGPVLPDSFADDVIALQNISDGLFRLPVRETSARAGNDFGSLFENISKTVTEDVPTRNVSAPNPAKGSVEDIALSVAIKNNPKYKLANGKTVEQYYGNPALAPEFEEVVEAQVNRIKAGQSEPPNAFAMYTEVRNAPVKPGDSDDVISMLRDQPDTLFKLPDGREVTFKQIDDVIANNPAAWNTLGPLLKQSDELKTYNSTADKDFMVQSPGLAGTPEKLAQYLEKPNLGGTGNVPPPSPKNSDLSMSEIGMATEADEVIAKRNEFLLPFREDYRETYVRSDNYQFESVANFATRIKAAMANGIERAAKGEKPSVQKVQKQIIESKKFGPKTKQYREWAETVRKIVTPRLFSELAKAGSEKQFDDIINTAITVKSPAGFQSIDQVQAAYRAGFVDEEDLIELFTIAGLKNPKDVKRNFSRLKQKVEATLKRTTIPAVVKPVEEASETVVEAADDVLVATVKDSTPPTGNPAAVAPNQGYLKEQTDAAIQGYMNIPEAARPVINDALRKVLGRQFVEPNKNWQYVTNKGSLRDTPVTVKGQARNRAFNRPVQGDLSINITKALQPFFRSDEWKLMRNKYIEDGTGFGAESGARANFIAEVLGTTDKMLRGQGIQPIIGTKGHSGYGLSLGDIMQNIGKADSIGGVPFWSAIKTGGRTSIPDNDIMEMVEAVLDYKMGTFTREYVDAKLDAIIKGLEFEKHTYRGAFKNEKGLKAAFVEAKNLGVPFKSFSHFKNSYSKAVREVMWRAVATDDSPLMARLAENHIAAAVGDKAQVAQLSDGLVARLIELAENPNMTVGGLDADALIARIYNTKTEIPDNLWDTPPANPGVASSATIAAKLKIVESVGPEIVQEAIQITRIKNGSPTAGQVRYNNHRVEAEEIDAATDALRVGPDDFEEPAFLFDTAKGSYDPAAGATNGFIRAVTRTLSYVNPRLGNPVFNEVVWKNRNAVSTQMQLVTRAYNQMHRDALKLAGGDKALAKDMFKQAFTAYQQGVRPGGGPVGELSEIANKHFDLIFKNIIDRNRLSLSSLNARLAHFGVNPEWMFEGKNVTEALDSWRKWKPVDDPLEQMLRVYTASQLVATETMVGREFASMLTQKGLLRNTRQPGFMKVEFAPELQSFAAGLAGKYMPKEIALEMQTAMNFMQKTTGRSGSTDFMTQYFDPVQSMFKAGYTIYRPGHHVRNLYGDVTLNFLAGVTSPTAYAKSARIMYSVRGNGYSNFDMAAMMEGIGQRSIQGAKSKIKVGRKEIEDQDVYELARKEGILPAYNLVEDINPGMTEFSPIERFKQRVSDKTFKGNVQKVAAGASEVRDHYVRIAHFVDRLEYYGKRGSYADAVKKAGREVRKWHPDGSNLTPFERDYARRIFTFYSWVARALPLVFEATALNPGRALIYPKAMYNLAEANGIDLESMHDPFPDDHVFPEFMTREMTGVQFQSGSGAYYGITPGDPVSDVLNDFVAGSPGDTLVNSLTPWIKFPIEGVTGRNLATGREIPDRSDQFDLAIPLLGPLSNITNRSATTLFTQKQRDAEGNRGNSEAIDVPALFNFITGAGLANKSKMNYLPIAEQEIGREITRQVSE